MNDGHCDHCQHPFLVEDAPRILTIEFMAESGGVIVRKTGTFCSPGCVMLSLNESINPLRKRRPGLNLTPRLITNTL